ncbi:preprotein translocase subunit SecE [Undibacterium seohonense]|jgi:preprotein translocase subunit SecE|uniref:Protein translocase subunit SecE n=1 Tax=Undibacterium seohonense TaxID=1344950 RepID=A0ABR6X1N9_9BURK|nr:preprotein translocase subunit SecE [Undibacterium seohonense]MBC3806868.1 preprotein translocase subunit SecE [Undibacterium seohonense]
MSNQTVQTVSTSNDKYKIILAVIAAVAGVVAFYVLANQAKYVRIGALFGGLALALVLVFISETGRELVSFAKESIREAKKVVWPTRKEAGQMTAVVFGFVLIMSIFLFTTDKVLEYLIMNVILGLK